MATQTSISEHMQFPGKKKESGHEQRATKNDIL